MAKLPGIYIPIQGDFGPFKEDISQAAAVAKKGGEDISRALNETVSTRQAQNAVTGLYRNLALMNRSAQASKTELEAIKLEFGALAEKAGLSESALNKLQQRMLQTRAEATAQRAMQQVQRATGMTAMEMVTLKYRMGDVKGAMSDFSTIATTRIRSMVGAIISLKGALAGLGLGMLARDIFQAGAQAEGLEKAFEAITGSADEASREMAYLRRVADELGLNFYSLAESYKGLLVSGAGTTIFEGVLNASAALQLSGDAIKGVLLAVEQMASKGVVSMEELRKQMGERLPGSFEMAANAMGMTAQEFSKAVASGRVLASDLLPALGRALTDRFGKAARENATSAARAVDKFQESWTDLKVQMAESGFLEAASEAMREVVEVFRDEETKKGMQALGQLFGDMAKVLAGATKNAVDLKRALDAIPAEVWGLLIGAGVGGRFGGPYGALAGGALGLGAGVRAGQDARSRETPEQARRRLIMERDAAIISGSGVGHYTGEGVFGQDFSKQVTGLTPTKFVDIADITDIAKGLDLKTPSAAVARSAYDPEESRVALAAGSLERFLEEQDAKRRALRDFDTEYRRLSMDETAFAIAEAQAQERAWIAAGVNRQLAAEATAMRIREIEADASQAQIREAEQAADRQARALGSLISSFGSAMGQMVNDSNSAWGAITSTAIDAMVTILTEWMRTQAAMRAMQTAGSISSLFNFSSSAPPAHVGQTSYDVGGPLPRASGGPTWPGRWLVGEQGPEIWDIGPNGRGYVHNATATRAMRDDSPRVQVNVINQSEQQVEAKERTGMDGQPIIDIVVHAFRRGDRQLIGSARRALNG